MGQSKRVVFTLLLSCGPSKVFGTVVCPNSVYVVNGWLMIWVDMKAFTYKSMYKMLAMLL